MKYFVMDILACPVCKSDDLLLHVIDEVEEEVDLPVERIKCKRKCYYRNTEAGRVPLEVCKECMSKRIKTAVIVCRNCGRWYPVMETIAVMLDDEYRDEKTYAKFIRENLDKIPAEVQGLMKIPEIPRTG